MYDIKKIMEFLPHRYPFLLVDKILELKVGERLVGLKNVTINEPFFAGHFPNEPVMPGVLILEAMAQAGGVLAFETFQLSGDNHLIYLMSIDRVKFRKPVVPGDQLIFNITMLKKRALVVRMRAEATVDGVVVTEGEMMATIGERP